jgi:archaemetzincin
MKRGNSSFSAIGVEKVLLSALALLALPAGLAMNFKPPTSTERLRAIGSTKGLAKTLRKALEPGADFEPIPVPKRGDWLAEHPETGQRFDDFVKSRPNRPDKYRSKIYLQPLSEFPSLAVPLAETLKEYAAAYFAMEIQILPVLKLNDESITTRINTFTGKRQILTGDVLAILRKSLPKDAFCVMAITMEDLYPQPSWNFVFGQASLRERVGVYSFARYDPVFYGQARGRNYEKLLLWRSCKVLVHEIAHMFGLTHCIYFMCGLNGSNHLKESDSRPMHLCPVCLRKLQHSTRFEVVSRYGDLFSFYKKTGFDDQAQWVKGRLERVVGTDAARKILEPNRQR